MRSGAGTGSSVVGTYDKGTKMSVIGAAGNWYEVSYNGKTGYEASWLRAVPDGLVWGYTNLPGYFEN